MIVVSAGMQKSGSTLLHAYATSLIEEHYGPAGQRAFEHWIATGPVGGSGAFPWDGWTARVPELHALARAHGPFVLKTHAAYPVVRDALRDGPHRFIFSYRDPRDAVLSALDHGARSRRNSDWPYAECTDVANTLPRVVAWCEAVVTWLDADREVAPFRYEEMVTSPATEVARLARHLLACSPEEAAQAASVAIEREIAGRAPGRNQFHTGRAHRWRTEMSPEDLQTCETILHPHLVRMGYPLASAGSA